MLASVSFVDYEDDLGWADLPKPYSPGRKIRPSALRVAMVRPHDESEWRISSILASGALVLKSGEASGKRIEDVRFYRGDAKPDWVRKGIRLALAAVSG
jgi:hypothetical protein